jgi:hypothetical protein
MDKKIVVDMKKIFEFFHVMYFKIRFFIYGFGVLISILIDSNVGVIGSSDSKSPAAVSSPGPITTIGPGIVIFVVGEILICDCVETSVFVVSIGSTVHDVRNVIDASKIIIFFILI